MIFRAISGFKGVLPKTLGSGQMQADQLRVRLRTCLYRASDFIKRHHGWMVAANGAEVNP